LYTTRGELLRRLGRDREAIPNYERALGMTSNEVERTFLRAHGLLIGAGIAICSARIHGRHYDRKPMTVLT
jgi:hypothetical protein